mmetsp:Transcript_8302/g.27629  ORF Transcript_8302/g.27629 Transcript_8302/m.27629 type:complete len:513 (+) Transcript_8302:159-1697(+)
MLTPHSLGLHKILSLLSPLVRPVVNWNAERRLANAVNVSDIRDCAKQRAHKMVFDYLDSGADDEVTLRRNKDAFVDLEFHYKVLAGLKPPLDLSTRVLGNDVEVPFFPSPTAGSKMFHADGEIGIARAAKKVGAMYCLSTMGTTSPRDLAASLGTDSSDLSATPQPPKRLFQLYVWRDRSLVRDLLAQAKESGFTSLALTADLTWYGNREMDTRNGFTVPPSYSSSQVLQALKKPAWSWDFLANDEYAYAALDVAVRARQERAAACSVGNTSTRNHPEAEEPLPTDRRAQVSFIRDAFDPSFNWNDAEWLCDEWGSVGPVALKGVVRPDDASRAVASGFDAVWVSNHGGRQLEGAVAPIDVLPSIRGAMGGTEAWCAAKNVADSVRKGGGGDAEIATAVAQRVPDMKTSLRTGLPVEIILDGGITRGTDIVKALVLGADAVGLGKPFLFGLCAGGETGVRKVFEILREETERAMGLLGAGSVQDLREANSGKREDEKFVRRRSTGRGRDFRV